MRLSEFTVLEKCQVCYLKKKFDRFPDEKYQNQLTNSQKHFVHQPLTVTTGIDRRRHYHKVNRALPDVGGTQGNFS